MKLDGMNVWQSEFRKFPFRFFTQSSESVNEIAWCRLVYVHVDQRQRLKPISCTERRGDGEVERAVALCGIVPAFSAQDRG